MSNLTNFPEEWKVIPEFPDYSVSNYGRVKSNARTRLVTNPNIGKTYPTNYGGRFMKEHLNHVTGYKSFQLYRDGKQYIRYAHRLVAECFIENKEDFETVNHKDGNKHNNFVHNLEWCTQAYNMQHAIRTGLKPRGPQVRNAKLVESNVDAIRRMFSLGYTNAVIAKVFDVTPSVIWNIRNNRSWKSYLMVE